MVISVTYNHHVLGLEASLNFDEIQLLILSGYICK